MSNDRRIGLGALSGHEILPILERIEFWLLEVRTPERLVELTARFIPEAQRLLKTRPLLALAMNGDLPDLRTALDAEVRVEQEKDRIYWEPLKREMESFRRAERENNGDRFG